MIFTMLSNMFVRLFSGELPHNRGHSFGFQQGNDISESFQANQMPVSCFEQVQIDSG